MNPLDPLIFAGNVIDTPWAMGRAALAGKNPLEGVFDVDRRTSGRDMLESWGLLGQNREGFDAGDVAGFAVEMLDPISLATGMWAPKAIRALKGAKALGSVDEVADVAKAGGALVPRVSEPMLDPAALKPLSAIPAANPALPPTPDVIPLSGPGLPLLNPPVPPFYSRLERAAQQLPGQQFKAQSLPNLLKKAPEGVAQEEMDWVLKGLPKQGVVKKDELLRTIDEGGIKIEERLLAGPDVKWGPPTDKFAVPGGSSYKELLLKLPEEPRQFSHAVINRDTDEVVKGFASRTEAEAEVARLGDNFSIEDPDLYGLNTREKPFLSQHWEDDPNVLAHVRFDDRIAPDGKKTLFVQEVQSDWHQAGKKGGYQGTSKAVEVKNDAGDMSVWRVRRHDGSFEPGVWRDQRTAESFAASVGSVPDAPFKDNEWANLALKRVLQYATDNGYDRIAFNSGELAAKFNAGGAEGKTAEGIAKWYDEVLPKMFAKLVKKHGAKPEPFYISRGVPGKNVARTGEFELDDVMDILDDAPQPFSPKDPAFNKADWGMSFQVPNAMKQEIAHKGLPLLSLLPLGVGIGALSPKQSQAQTNRKPPPPPKPPRTLTDYQRLTSLAARSTR